MDDFVVLVLMCLKINNLELEKYCFQIGVLTLWFVLSCSKVEKTSIIKGRRLRSSFEQSLPTKKRLAGQWLSSVGSLSNNLSGSDAASKISRIVSPEPDGLQDGGFPVTSSKRNIPKQKVSTAGVSWPLRK